jgi:hypothetical protein
MGQVGQHSPGFVTGSAPSAQTGYGQGIATQVGPPPTLLVPATDDAPPVETEPPLLLTPPMLGLPALLEAPALLEPPSPSPLLNAEPPQAAASETAPTTKAVLRKDIVTPPSKKESVHTRRAGGNGPAS